MNFLLGIGVWQLFILFRNSKGYASNKSSRCFGRSPAQLPGLLLEMLLAKVGKDSIASADDFTQ